MRRRFIDGVTVVSVRGDVGDLLGRADEGKEKGSVSGKGSAGSYKRAMGQ